MRHYIIASLLFFAFCSRVSGYDYTPNPVYTDVNTGIQWEDPGYLAFMGWNTQDFIQNSGVHLATYEQVLQLFSDIGPYTSELNKYFGATAPLGDIVITSGFYDSGNGKLGLAYAGYSKLPGDTTWDGTWKFYSDVPLSLDHGLWAIVEPVPEPCTVLLVGFGLAGVGLVRRKKSSM